MYLSVTPGYDASMSAFGFDDEQTADLAKALKDRIDRLRTAPHVRLGFPPACKGTDVAFDWMATEQTLETLRRRNMS